MKDSLKLYLETKDIEAPLVQLLVKITTKSVSMNKKKNIQMPALVHKTPNAEANFKYKYSKHKFKVMTH